LIQQLLGRFSRLPATATLIERLCTGGRMTAAGLVGSARSFLAVTARVALERTTILILDDDHSARAALADITVLAPGSAPLFFDPGAAGLVRRIAALKSGLVVAPAPTLTLPAPAPEAADCVTSLHAGAARDVKQLIEWLEANGYERTDLVTEPGEYAARGGIVDVYPEGADLPVRVEFVADLVESLRTFDPLLQRSTSRLAEVPLPTRRPAEQSDTPASALLPQDALIITEGPVLPAFASVELTGEADADFDLGCAPLGSFVGNIDQLKAALGTYEHADIVCASESQCARLATILGPGPAFSVGPLSSGFANQAESWAVITEREVYGAPVTRAVRHKFKGLPVDNIVSLRPGDHVVHIDYGVAKFEGTRRMKHGDIEKDFLVLGYHGSDRVYVPVENLGLLDRYVGGEEAAPALDRLGGRGWLIAKAKAAKASAEYAQELLDVYARRSVARGTNFGPDNPWQAELEASFPYEETPDQLRVLAEVKRDMEQSKPMDRLVCGDVGYGKTEVALRAAFKAAVAGKQVALLAPTTILCYQHFATFRRRLGRFPLRVEMLSRFVGPDKQRGVLAGLADGTVDVVIGTHQLLGARIRFRDLGLLVIDEEQKFGVRQKERIRALKSSVDVLTLSATPIPRTLYMGLAGLRDVSQINTPPPGRREIHTEVSPWNDDLIREYLTREFDRGGQVFFVHNEIQSIDSVARKVERLLPGVKMAVGHGQMTGRHLADIYLGFAAGDFRLLLSTAIIESGLDMPNVNTIIVNRADRFGLADLHQLRGRVGRSQEQAYALFLVPTQHETSPDARKRLSALLAYSKLGSGFKLALRDMEIRGVGNLLGTEQHGHVARVGFNLYTQMLKEAVANLKGEQVAPEPELALDVPAYIPKEYVADSFERVAIYKRLLAVDTEPELDELKTELADRFGRYPDSVEPLFDVALVRVRSRKLGLLKVTLKHDQAVIVGTEKTVKLAGGMPELLRWLQHGR
jgi:transcription-repair coupling factor